ncbi:VENN motif pre-toxin domain-containing protein, partial [Photorhabdus sp. P32]|uniref:VENN motif pre-toxin domain-containing protein n=1 Tax=Photorhabdus sp. P32 TaxID=3117549 RepID=UPI00311AE2E4
QENVSAGAGFTYGSMSGSASVNASRDKMHSKFESVKEQTGIFAGKGGFDIRVGEHTQLDGAVIGSTADKDRNRLETGTLGFSDIRNKAEYKTEHQSVGMSTGGAVGSQLVSNLSSNMLSGANHSDSKSSTTHAAVSDGTITVRDADKQKQDIAGLSRDTENAANGLTPIFDKEKEQRRLAQAQAIANIGIQVMDIYNTQEAITATKKATEALKDPERQQALKQQAEAQLKQENGIVTAETIADRAYKIAYDGAIKGQGADIGGNRRQAVTAVVAALQGLAGGDIKAAIASGAAPYLSNAVKKVTYGDKAYEQLTPEEKATNVVAHAILGGVIAELKGGSAIAGSVGAAGGELAASVIAGALYPDKKLSELTADEKEKISHLSTLAGGIAAGLVTDSTAGGVDGAQTAKNAVENNFLTAKQIDDFVAKAKGCEARGDCNQIVKEMEDLSLKQRNELIATCASDPAACKEKYGELPANSMLVRQAVDKALGEDIPWSMKNDLSVLLMQQMDESGIVNSTEFAQKLEKQFGLDKQRAEILAGAAMSAMTGGMGSKGSKPSSSNVVKDNKGANTSTGQQVNAGNSEVKTPQNQTGKTTNHLIPESFVADVTKHNTQLGVVNRKMGTISGAHKQDAFLESVEMTGGKINHKITDKRYPGLIEYKYQIPAINGRGQQIGFKKETVKTTYDPKVLSDTKIADMSNKAAKQAENYFRDNPNHRQYSAKVDGYWFQVTRDAKTGQVNNAFITMPARTSK